MPRPVGNPLPLVPPDERPDRGHAPGRPRQTALAPGCFGARRVPVERIGSGLRARPAGQQVRLAGALLRHLAARGHRVGRVSVAHRQGPERA
jgi:hypothetical protein